MLSHTVVFPGVLRYDGHSTVKVYGVWLYAIFFLSDIIVISNFFSLVLMNHN